MPHSSRCKNNTHKKKPTVSLFRFLLGNSGVEDLCPEETTLGLLNDLLVDVVGRVVHHHSAVLAVDLGVQSSLADKVDNPLLTIVGVQTELGAEVADVHSAEDLAVALADEVSGGLDKGVGGRGEEEVASAHLGGLGEGLTGSLEIVGDVESADELGDRVGVLVGLLADIADDVLDLLLLDGAIASTTSAGDNGGDQISQHPGAGGLDGVDERSGEEHVQDGLPGALPVKEGEEGPVEEHCSVVELSTGVVEELGVDVFPHILDLLNSRLPVGLEDLRGELAPGGSRNLVVVGGQNSELVEHIGGGTVLSASELELTEVVKGVDHLHGDLVRSPLAKPSDVGDKKLPCHLLRAGS